MDPVLHASHPPDLIDSTPEELSKVYRLSRRHVRFGVELCPQQGREHDRVDLWVFTFADATALFFVGHWKRGPAGHTVENSLHVLEDIDQGHRGLIHRISILVDK